MAEKSGGLKAEISPKTLMICGAVLWLLLSWIIGGVVGAGLGTLGLLLFLFGLVGYINQRRKASKKRS